MKFIWCNLKISYHTVYPRRESPAVVCHLFLYFFIYAPTTALKCTEKRFIPFTPIHFLPKYFPYTEFKGSPAYAPPNVFYNTSFQNYPSFSKPFHSILTPLWVCTNSVLWMEQKRVVSMIVAGSMYFVAEPQKKYKAEQIATANIRLAKYVKHFSAFL